MPIDQMGRQNQPAPWSFTMRIDGYLPTHDAQATDGTRRTGADGGVRPGGQTGPVASSSSSDRLELSGDMALASAAVRSANELSGIRADRVAEAREKLLNGGVAADPIALADAILNELWP
jgi:anti-sigma28 factor (negative regulator of flagellin synthesis)